MPGQHSTSDLRQALDLDGRYLQKKQRLNVKNMCAKVWSLFYAAVAQYTYATVRLYTFDSTRDLSTYNSYTRSRHVYIIVIIVCLFAHVSTYCQSGIVYIYEFIMNLQYSTVRS